MAEPFQLRLEDGTVLTASRVQCSNPFVVARLQGGEVHKVGAAMGLTSGTFDIRLKGGETVQVLIAP